MNRTSAELFVLAAQVDARGQYDLADRMERLAIDIDDIGEEYHGGFDPEHQTFRGPGRNPITRPQFADPNSPHYDPDRVKPGHKPWLQSPDVMRGHSSGEFERLRPGEQANDPGAQTDLFPGVDEEEVMGQVMGDLRADYPEMADMDDDEIVSRLIHAVYASMRYDDPAEFEAMVASGKPIDYDPEILKQAKREVSRMLGIRFEPKEQVAQENYEPYDPRG